MPTTTDRLDTKLTELQQFLEGWSYIVFLIDREADINSGLNSKDIDLGDALVCIERIVEEFEVDPVCLHRAITRDKSLEGI